MVFHLVIFSLFFSNVKSLHCGVTNYKRPELLIEERIVGGRPAIGGSWPWLVALATRKIDGPDAHIVQSFFKCGGSLITNRHVLTAAHCCDEKLYLARLGASYLHSVSFPTIDVLIEKVIIHQDFDVIRAYNDIALVILNKRVKFNDHIRPICLPKNSYFLNGDYENSSFVIAGWGDVNYGSGTGFNLLQEVELPIYDVKECQRLYKEHGTNVTNKNICVGYTTGGKDACQGDSGGPLMAKGPQGKFYFVIGVISHGLSCGSGGIPSVYTRVSAYLPWINQVIKETKTYSKGKIEETKSKGPNRFDPIFSTSSNYRRINSQRALIKRLGSGRSLQRPKLFQNKTKPLCSL